MSTSRPILTIDKLVKITMVYDKMLTICKKFREKQLHDMLCKKREIDGCAPWKKRDGLYASWVVGSQTIHMGYVKQEL